jgi:Protein of unknown function (DUF1553)/Protein of unknown function (DUF1549)/Concanavalin A-like lectin/glucanases superfamily/Planctomycete cytochrome C
MRSSPVSRLGCLLLTLLIGDVADAAVAPDAIRFDRDIAPLLARRCLDCHSGPAPKGKIDLGKRAAALKTLVPGKRGVSRFWKRIRDDEMPPNKPLHATEKELLRAWIASGAGWGTDPIDPYRVTTATRGGYDWWSLQPIKPVSPPTPCGEYRAHNPIDRFLLVKLEAKKLTPSPQADRRTLIRRLSFDLVGLPPSPDEVEAFLADARPDAYERLVDRLLASPQHGERYARHWLDVARYGESDGFERDLPRFDAWPYRDWVVRAFNRDMPYDEFARLQLAGDLLRPADPEAVAATGFLVAGPHDIVVPVGEPMREAMRQDELEDIVGTVGQTFLGLTVHCARCHDHKFDPVPTRDYYRLAAGLSGVRHGTRRAVTPQTKARLAQSRTRIQQLRGELDAIEEPIRQKLIASGRPSAAPRPVAEWDFTRGPTDLLGGVRVELRGKATLGPTGLRLDGKDAYALTPPLSHALGAKTLEAWVRLDSLDQRGGGVLSLQTPDGGAFDAIVFGEQQPGHWMAGSEGFRRTRSFAGPAEKDATRRAVHVAITYAPDGTVTAYRDGTAYGRAYRADRATFAANKSQLLFGLRHSPAGDGKHLAGVISRAKLYDRALSADEVAASFGQPIVSPTEVLAKLGQSDRPRHHQLTMDLLLAEASLLILEKLGDRKVYAVTPTNPGKTHVLIRGDASSPGEAVSAEVLTALASRLPATKVGVDAGDNARRAALAGWIADARNPLFARVMANRLWQYHFGVGLVETPSDLGFNGGRPSHPELLDWLAQELIDSGWSLKHLHRVIVTSAAYQQASGPRPEASRIDADNRLVWRKSPRRLEAESLRDAFLAVTGDLDTRLGGAPYLDFKTYFFKGTQFYDPIEQVGKAFNRRSLYRLWARGGRDPLLDALDCPDPSATTPRRATTSTPLQALTLFNNAFVLHQAEVFGQRLAREAGREPSDQTRLAYRLAFGRAPTPAEERVVVPFVKRHGAAALARVLFNTSEFLTID